MILSSALSQSANKNPGNPAIWDLGQGISYHEFRKKVGQLSYLFLAEIGHHQRVAFLADNTPAVALTIFSLSNSCTISILLNPKDSDEKLIEFLKEIEATHIAVTNSQVRRAQELLRTSGLPLAIIEIEKKKGGEYDESYSPPPEIPLKETDLVLVMRSAGVTDKPKTIFFTHKQLYSAATQIRRHYHLGANDKIFTTMHWSDPFAFIHGMLFPLLNGACCAVDPQFRGPEFIEYIAQHRINRFVDTPPALFNLLQLCQSNKYLLPGVKSVTIGRGLLSPGLRKTFSLLKIPVMHCYGMVENVWTIALEDGENAEYKNEIKCKPLPGLKYKVINDAGDEIEGPERKEGPLCVTGETVMNGYFHIDPKIADKATKMMKRGTWLYTGDIARMEGEGEELTISFLGRQTDLLKGEQDYISMDKIDSVIAGIPGVTEGAAFVRKNEKDEPQLACAIVKQSKTLSPQEVLETCGANLLPAEKPVAVYFLDALPKDPFGNVNRFSLQRQFSGTA